MRKNLFLCILIVFICAFGAWPQQQVTDARMVLAFADWLYGQGEFTRAAGEYLRFLFLSKNRSDPEVIYKIGLCYRYAGDYAKAVKTFSGLLPFVPDGRLKEDTYYQLAYCFFLTESYKDSLAAAALPGEGEEAQNGLLLLLQAADSLCLKEWQSALRLSTAYLRRPDQEHDPVAVELSSLAREGSGFPRKSPVFAGILSAVIPGSGKIYAGRFMDGLISLVTVGIFGGMAVYSFCDEGIGSVRGWIYAGVGGIFYLGDIYGSVTAAQLYNREQEDRIILRVRRIVGNDFP
jgi:TM2 domain-containing membrane protein YozV